MHAGLACELEDLWQGSLSFANRTANYTLDGRRLDVQIRGRILPGHEALWDCVLVSLEDVTAEMRSARQLHRSEQYSRDLFEYSPVSLWVEDFSAIKRLLDDVRAPGHQRLRHLPQGAPGIRLALHAGDSRRGREPPDAAHVRRHRQAATAEPAGPHLP